MTAKFHLTTSQAVLAYIIIGLLVFANSLLNPFIGDDFGQLVDNPFIHSLRNIPHLLTGSTFYLKTAGSLSGNYYKPLMSFVFAFLYSLAGAHSFLYHLLQVSLHIANAILIFLFFKHFFKIPLSFLLSLIFLVHPINAEAVIYISGLQDPLFLFFGLLALNLIAGKKINNRRLTYINLFLFLSLLAKETGLLFVIILSFYCFLFYKPKFWPSLLSFLITFVIYLTLRFMAIGFTFNQIKAAPIMIQSLPIRLLNLPAIIIYYFKTFFFPKDLIVLQNWVIRQFSFSAFLFPMLLLILITLALIFFGFWLYRHHGQQFYPFLFFSLWLVIGLAFHAQIFPLDLTVSDRWFYLPEIAVLALLGLFISTITWSSKIPPALSVLLFIGIVAGLSVRTTVRNSNWQQPFKLYFHDLSHDPNNYFLEASVGSELAKIEKFDEAEVHLKKSLSISAEFPNYDTWKDLCVNYALRGNKTGNNADLIKAETCFKELILARDRYDFYLLLSKLLMQKNDYEEAKNYLSQSLTKYPNDAESWYFLAVSQAKLNQNQAALEAVAKSYQLMPTREAQDLYLQLSSLR